MVTEPARIASRATWAILIGALVAMLACCWLVDFDRILRRTPDDAYYFFQIAANVAAGHGATFDGIHKTSGFQPLWMLCLVPVLRLCPDSPEMAVRIGLSLQAVALFVGGLLIVSVLSRIFSRQVVFGVAAFYTFSIFALCVNGMESAVEMLAIAALFAYGFHAKVFFAGRPSLWKELLFGILLGVVMLARLDMLFLGAAVLAFRAWPAIVTRQGRWRNIAGSLAIFMGAVLTVSPYLIYNYATFGTSSPISGALKSNFPHASLAQSWAALRYCVGLPKLLLLFSIVVAAVVYLVRYAAAARSELKKGTGSELAGQAAARNDDSEAPVPIFQREARDARFYFHTSMAVLAFAVVLHFLHTVLFMKWAIWTWHFFPYFLFAAVAVAGPLEKFLSLRIGRAVSTWAISALVVAGILGYGLRMTVSGRTPTWQTATYEAALWSRQHTDRSDVFALKDTGNFGFFSGRRVINLDGVVNDLEYQKVLSSRKLTPYFQANGVKYLVMHAGKDEYPRVFDGAYQRDSAAFQSHLYGDWSEPIPLSKQDEVYRATYSHPNKGVFVIWNCPGPRNRDVADFDRLGQR